MSRLEKLKARQQKLVERKEDLMKCRRSTEHLRTLDGNGG